VRWCSGSKNRITTRHCRERGQPSPDAVMLMPRLSPQQCARSLQASLHACALRLKNAQTSVASDPELHNSSGAVLEAWQCPTGRSQAKCRLGASSRPPSRQSQPATAPPPKDHAACSPALSVCLAPLSLTLCNRQQLLAIAKSSPARRAQAAAASICLPSPPACPAPPAASICLPLRPACPAPPAVPQRHLPAAAGSPRASSPPPLPPPTPPGSPPAPRACTSGCT
jgi:hypothetical protein